MNIVRAVPLVAWALLPFALRRGSAARFGAMIFLGVAPLIGLETLLVVDWFRHPTMRLGWSLPGLVLAAVLSWPLAFVAVGGCAAVLGRILGWFLVRLAANPALGTVGLVAAGTIGGAILGLLIAVLIASSSMPIGEWIPPGVVAGIVAGGLSARRIVGELRQQS